MNDPQPIDAPRPNHSTGPRTPEGKARCRLKRRFHSSTNAYRHGITGQIHVQTPEEQQAYDQHCKITLEALAPVGDFERSLAQSVADDRWRLNRARAIESSMFALGLHGHGEDNTGQPELDQAFSQARTWIEDARNLQLLTIYEQRLQRSVDKNTAELRTLQAARKDAAQEAMCQAKLLYQIDEAEGIPWQPEAYFYPLPETRESVFSTTEVVRELRFTRRLYEAKLYDYPKNPRKI